MSRREDETRGALTLGGFEPLEPSPFGKYTLVARLGQGGMADVFLAVASGPAGFRKLVVVKRLHPELEKAGKFIGMFLDEARLAARLNHPNVVQTSEVGEVDGRHYLAMEYLEGQTLGRVLRRAWQRGEPPPVAIIGYVATEMLEGLAYAHDLRDFDGTPLGVVHRDISPSNVMITYDGVVKILDFGIAKAETQLEVTGTGVRKGKVSYFAPEQLQGTIDRRVDLFCVGVILWEAFAGRRLFLDKDPVSTLENVKSAPIPPLRSVCQHEIPDGLEAVVAKALRRNPAQRYLSATEMGAELDRVMTTGGHIVRRSDAVAFMAGLFPDIKESHLVAAREAVEAALSDRPPPMAPPSIRLDDEGFLEPTTTTIVGAPSRGVRERIERMRPALAGGVRAAQDGLRGGAKLARDRIGPLLSRHGAQVGPLLRQRRVQAALGAAVVLALVVALVLPSGDASEDHEDRSSTPEQVDRATSPEAAPGPEPEAEVEVPDPPDLPPPDPAEFERARNEGREHFQARRWDEAAAAYRRATVLRPEHAGSFAGLGASLLADDRTDEAITAYEEAVRLDPTHSGFHAALGRAYRAGGRNDEAVVYYERALELDPANGAASQALRELRR